MRRETLHRDSFRDESDQAVDMPDVAEFNRKMTANRQRHGGLLTLFSRQTCTAFSRVTPSASQRNSFPPTTGPARRSKSFRLKLKESSSGGYFVPPPRNVKSQFVRDFFTGRKALLKTAEVKPVKGLNFRQLTLKR